MAKKKLTHEEILTGDGVNYIRRILDEKEKDSGTFWYPRCVELLDIYKKIINEHPEDVEAMTLDDIMIAFARHAFYYAFKQR